MADIKLVEQYSVNLLRECNRNAMQWFGEEAILLQAFHPGDADAVACNCRDDIYNQAPANCPDCYGTTFQGGIRQAARVWTLFSDTRKPEQYAERGTWQLDSRELQTEALPMVVEHDFVVRVSSWGDNHTVNEVYGYYAVQAVTRDSLRTGNRFGQQLADVVGQRVTVTELSPTMPICSYPIAGLSFARATQAYDPSLSQNVPAVQPDTKVVFVPGAASAEQDKYAETIGDGTTTTFVIEHNLGSSDVDVTVRSTSTGETVDADEFVLNDNEVRVTFGVAPAPGAFRVVVLA